LLADNKLAGLPFDALDITKPNDWMAYNAQIKRESQIRRATKFSALYRVNEPAFFRSWRGLCLRK
jgi:hypothetical protein